MLWAMIPVAAKLGQGTLDHHQYLFYSSLLSFTTMLVVGAYSQKLHLVLQYKTKDILSVVVLGFLGTYIYYLLLYFGYKYAVGLEVLVVQYLWPVLIVVFGAVVLKERLTYRKIVAVSLGFVAVVAVVTKGDISSIDISNTKVLILVFVGASAFALFSVLSKRITLEPIGAITGYFLVATVSSWVSMMIFSDVRLPQTADIAPIVINGVFLNGISYLFWIKALKLKDASYIAPYIYATPVLSAFLLILVFDEPLYISYIFSLILVIVSGLININTTTK
ncbi:MAG: EamA/RhaT family transporter [Epsilonproteobacteria bacterium]|nr:MAG: EamA/RhaT family transporter [Campylobacterota bacterium]